MEVFNRSGDAISGGLQPIVGVQEESSSDRAGLFAGVFSRQRRLVSDRTDCRTVISIATLTAREPVVEMEYGG